MRKMFQRGTNSLRIIETICAVGELPYRSFRLMDNKHSMTITARTLIERGYIKEQYIYHNKRKVRTLLLTGEKKEDYLPYLFFRAEECHAKAMQNTLRKSAQASSKVRRSRNISVAESYIFAEVAGLTVRPDIKPDLSNEYIKEDIHAYFLPRELKDIMFPEQARAASGRAVGYIVSGNIYYMVYNLGIGSIVIQEGTERITRDRVEQVLNTRSLYARRNREIVHMDAVILLTKKYENMSVLITGKTNESEKKYFELSDIFSLYWLLPYTSHGAMLLSWLLDEDMRNRLIDIVLPREQRKTTNAIDCDAIYNEYISLVFFIPDVKRLKRFYVSILLDIKLQKETKYKIYCFDFQTVFLRNIFTECDKRVSIVSFSFDKVKAVLVE